MGKRQDQFQTSIDDSQKSMCDIISQIHTFDSRFEQLFQRLNLMQPMGNPSGSSSSTTIILGTNLPPPPLSSPFPSRTTSPTAPTPITFAPHLSPLLPFHFHQGLMLPSPPRLKMDFPQFDGVDPLTWITKEDNYFTFYQTPEIHRIIFASVHLDGRAFEWYQWLMRNQLVVSWLQFTHAVEARFGPSEFDDAQGALSKLTQTITADAYVTEFEQLMNRTSRLPQSFFISCFVARLQFDICAEVLAT